MSARLQDVFLYDLQPQIAALPISVEGPVECEIQLCRTGAFYRSDMGHFKVTQTTLQKMLSNAVERAVDIPVNYHHFGNDPSKPKEDREAAGWVSPKTLTIRSYKGGYALFGVARWTRDAVTALKGEKLRYISPEIEWAAVRMAASEAGAAGEPIGPMLTGAALVNDPFFTMNPVTLSRIGAPQRGQRPGASKRYRMLSEEKKAKVEALLKGKLVEGIDLQGLVAQLCLEMMTEETTATPEVIEETVMPEEGAPAITTEAAAAQSLAASREANAALAKRVADLEARDKTREKEAAAQLFARYQSEGRFRVYAKEGTDPDGSKKAKELLARGTAFFREVFDAIPALAGTRAPAAPAGLPTAAGNPNAMAGQDGGRALHDRVMSEIKAKGLKMTEYNRIAAQFARG